MRHVRKSALSLQTQLVFLLPRVATLLLKSDALKECTTVAGDFIKLVVVLLDPFSLEAVKETLHAQMHLVVCLRGDIYKRQAPALSKLSVCVLQVLLARDFCTDISIDSLVDLTNYRVCTCFATGEIDLFWHLTDHGKRSLLFRWSGCIVSPSNGSRCLGNA